MRAPVLESRAYLHYGQRTGEDSLGRGQRGVGLAACKGLDRSGISADSVANATDATRALSATRYAAVVLDLGLPGEDGLSWLPGIRERRDSTPVLVLTARDGITDRVAGLREGADDYMPSLSLWMKWSPACELYCAVPAICLAAALPSARSCSTRRIGRC